MPWFLYLFLYLFLVFLLKVFFMAIYAAMSKICLKPDGLMHVISMVEAECDIWILDVERSPFAWQEAGHGGAEGPKIERF